MQKRAILAAGLASALVSACLVYVPKETPPPDPDERLLVTPAQLARALGDRRTVVLHVGRDRASYDAGHIPGARFLALSSIATENDGLPVELPAADVLEAAFESVGVSDDSRVILYGDLQGLLAARAFFTLDYLGFANAALLDGGMENWRGDGHAVSTEAVTPARGSFTPRPRANVVVDANWVRQRMNDSTILLVDARPPAEFRGETPGEGVTRPGHIPGARNIFWRSALVSQEDPRLRSPDVLTASYTLADLETRDTIVAYCRTGVQASHAYFVARYLQKPVVMYDAGFIDWSRRGDDFPVER